MSAILMFTACDTRQCVDAIVDDVTLELTETFIVTLKRTPALENILLNSVDGDIEILDNDGRKCGIMIISHCGNSSI